jgi:hypothetical protein
MSANKTSVACVPGALPGGLQRTSFFNGMFLTQSDLEVEQRFWRMKRRLTNRALGQGVVWGLRATFDQLAQKLTLNPGYGLDCCGNDLLVQASFDARCSDLIDVTDPATKALLVNPTGNELALVLEYVECFEEPRAVHKDACTPTSDACEPSRVRETTRLTVAAPAALTASPIGKFVDGIQKIQDDLTKANDAALGEVFPEAGAQPAAAGKKFPFRLVVRLGEREVDLDANTFLTVINPAASPAGLQEVVTLAGGAAGGQIDLHFELIPDAGFVFYDGTVQMKAPAPLNDDWRLAPPFDVQLAWSIRLPVSAVLKDQPQKAKVSFDVINLSWAPLFGGGDRQRAHTFSLSLAVTYEQVLAGAPPPPSGLSFRACIEQLNLTGDGKGPDVDLALTKGSCLDPLSKAFFLDSLDDAADAPKTVLLAALYGWLTNLFGSDKGYPQGADVKPSAFDGQRILATWLYLTAWRLLFGADPAAPDSAPSRQSLAALLDSLMAEWCRGFFYVGPRCDASFHGAVLGTLTVDQTGLVSKLDLWKGRRWVLTGPLVSHWGAQLGLAPLDVVAGRLVDTICCLGLGKTANGTAASMALPPLGTQTPMAVLSGQGAVANLQTIADSGVFVTDGCYLLYGNDTNVMAMLANSGLTAVETHAVSWVGFLERLVDAMAAQRAPGTASTTYALYSIGNEFGDRPFLMVATDPPATGAFEKKRAAVAEIVGELMEYHQENANIPQLEEQPFPPLAVPAVVDFFIELLSEIPLTALLPELVRRGFPAGVSTVKVLVDRGVVTCFDALAQGIEALADLASPTTAAHVQNDPVVAALWEVITEMRTLSNLNLNVRSIWENFAKGASTGIAPTWAQTHPNQVFTRPALTDTAFQQVVVKFLDELRLTGNDLAAMVQCAAARAAGLRG